MTGAIRVALCQAELDIDQADSRWEATVGLARAAASEGAGLVVLPELATSGYCFAGPDELDQAAASSARRLDDLVALSTGLDSVFVAGIPESDGETTYNSAAVVHGGRVLGVARKAHLWDEERSLFAAGDRVPLVVDTPAGRVGVLVCYDLEFPEWVRMTREAGAAIIAAPVNWPLLPRPDGVNPIELTKAQASAAAYRIPIAVCDRAGVERGTEWVGGSCLIGRDGYLAVPPVLDGSWSGVLAGRVEPAGDTRFTASNDVLSDRRTDLYR